jgi:hypothetical protein
VSSIVIAIPHQVPRKYPVPDGFTYRELQTIKTVTGLRPAEFEDALNSGDPDIVIALAVICAKRAGHNMTADDLMDLEVGAITVEGDDDADPTTAGDAVEDQPATTPEDGGTPPSLASTASDPGNSPS